MIKIPTKKIQQWTIALRSGAYPQTRGKLQDDDGYCCLGVACDVFIPREKLRINLENDFIIGTMPTNQPNAPIWLKRISESFNYITELELYELNDDHKFTFDEIADLLELVYIHKALD